MKTIICKIVQLYATRIVLLLAIILLFTTRDTKIDWDKMVAADGLGYYAYLPATFIYHDLSFSFFNEVHPKYYPPGYNPPTRNFLNEFDGIKVNKYFPGVAILSIPFFLIAHVLAHAFGYPADGYSPIYQYAMGLAAIFYCWLGLLFLRKILLRFNFSSVTTFVVIVSLFIGTNLLYQTIYYSSASHVFLFFLITATSYYLMVLFDEPESKSALTKVMILLSLIVITRPQDELFLFLLPFFGATFPKVKSIFLNNIKRKQFWVLLLICVGIVSIVPVLWYIQTGRFYLNPYTGEHYYFNHPHFMDALFSFRKGWLLYTPLIGLSLFGLFFIPNKLKAMNLFLFLVLVVFINSCWWSWTYGPTSYSQRPMVDYYFIPALLLGFLLENSKNKKMIYVTRFIIVLLCFIIMLQTYQFRNGIMPSDYNSAENYFSNFFKTKSIAIYPIPKNIIVNYSKQEFNFDSPDSPQPITNAEHYSGNNSTFTNKDNPYSAGALIAIPAYMKNNEVSKIRATAMVKAQPGKGKPTLVIDFIHAGKSISYNGFELINFIHTNNWTKVEFGLTLPGNVSAKTDSLKFYFWDDKGGNTFIDDVKIEFITTDPGYELHP